MKTNSLSFRKFPSKVQDLSLTQNRDFTSSLDGSLYPYYSKQTQSPVKEYRDTQRLADCCQVRRALHVSGFCLNFLGSTLSREFRLTYHWRHVSHQLTFLVVLPESPPTSPNRKLIGYLLSKAVAGVIASPASSRWSDQACLRSIAMFLSALQENCTESCGNDTWGTPEDGSVWWLGQLAS